MTDSLKPWTWVTHYFTDWIQCNKLRKKLVNLSEWYLYNRLNEDFHESYVRDQRNMIIYRYYNTRADYLTFKCSPYLLEYMEKQAHKDLIMKKSVWT